MRMVLLAAIAAVVFEVFVLVFVSSADRTAVRNLPKWVWLVLCVVFPVLGGIAYLIYGRPMLGEPGFAADAPNRSAQEQSNPSPQRSARTFLMNFFGIEGADDDVRPNLPPEFKYQPEPRERKGPLAPDDDPEFLRELDRKLKNQRKDSAAEQQADETDDESGDK